MPKDIALALSHKDYSKKALVSQCHDPTFTKDEYRKFERTVSSILSELEPTITRSQTNRLARAKGDLFSTGCKCALHMKIPLLTPNVKDRRAKSRKSEVQRIAEYFIR